MGVLISVARLTRYKKAGLVADFRTSGRLDLNKHGACRADGYGVICRSACESGLNTRETSLNRRGAI